MADTLPSFLHGASCPLPRLECVHSCPSSLQLVARRALKLGNKSAINYASLGSHIETIPFVFAIDVGRLSTPLRLSRDVTPRSSPRLSQARAPARTLLQRREGFEQRHGLDFSSVHA